MKSFFDVASDKLEELTVMNRIQSRGTIRIICSKQGLDKPDKLKKDKLIELLEEQLFNELERRGIEEHERVAEAVIKSVEETPEVDGAYDAFSRV